jgi:4-phytase/acid phosphatase
MIRASLLALSLAFFCGCSSATAADRPAMPALRFVLILTRHGIRSPLKPNADIAKYAAQAWPDWGLAPGRLTPHGAAAARLMGAYYGDLYRRAGILGSSCPLDNVYLYTDSTSRTIVTGQELAAGMNGVCAPTLHHLSEGTRDPLIHTLGPHPPLLKVDPARALEALRVAAPQPQNFLRSQAPAFAALAAILACPSRSAPSCLPVRSLIFKERTDSKTGLARLDGPLAAGQSLAETFLLEYSNGMDAGWSRATPDRIEMAMSLYVASYAVGARTRYLAQVQGSNLLWHMSQTLAQFADGRQRLSGAYAPPATSRFVMIVAHDTNLSEIGGMLGLHWAFGKVYQADDTPPAGSLAFEVSQAGTSLPTVAIYYQVQTPYQARRLLSLTQGRPPLRVRVAIPGCTDPCALATLQQLIAKDVDPAFVINESPH